MNWRKLGLVYAPAGDEWWARSYATIPTAEVVDGTTVRVYFAAVDDTKRGRIGFVEINPAEPKKILHKSTEPVLGIGEAGAFDDSGVNPSCIVQHAGETLLYYIGWQRSEAVPYLLFAGLAKRNSAGQFERLQRVPVLDRTNAEPYLRSATSIMIEETFRAWYVSADSWTEINGKPYPTYRIRYAESPDGISWSAHESVSIDFVGTDEFGLGRPWVIKDGSVYRMWYSIRSRTSPYSLGYAESTDGYVWERKDSEAGLTTSQLGWDSEMVCYPCVVDVGGSRYMFYNGNQHGSTGFGLAVLE